VGEARQGMTVSRGADNLWGCTMLGLAPGDMTGLDGSQAVGGFRYCLLLPNCCRIGDPVTSNNPLSQDGAYETSAPLGAPPPVLPLGAGTTVGSVPLDPQVLEAQRATSLEQLVIDQAAANAQINAQIQQLMAE
jgi:hypothetical protein